MSIIGFVAHYVHFLDPFRRPGALPEATDDDADEEPRPVLLLAGYSYGAMITTQLPSLDTVLSIFDAPESGSAAAEIRLRGEHLADTQNTVLASARAAALERQVNKSPRKSLGLRIGGDEDIRKSHDLPRRSFSMDAEEKFRDFVAKTRKRHHRPVSSESVLQKQDDLPAKGDGLIHGPLVTEHLYVVSQMTRFRPAHLLVSPLQGPILHLAAMSSSNVFGTRTAKPANDKPLRVDANAVIRERAALWAEAEEKLMANSTLALYGDQDGFVSAKKVRDWANRLAKPPKSHFRAQEVSTAGHFWREGRVIYTLRDAVRTFAASLLLPEHLLQKCVTS
jgi:alpha/beta superfamily hydrolase